VAAAAVKETLNTEDIEQVKLKLEIKMKLQPKLYDCGLLFSCCIMGLCSVFCDYFYLVVS
jgi:hypothetical protein